MAQLDRVESDGAAESLAEEIDQLRYLGAFNPVRVDAIRIADCRNDLQTKDSNKHPRQGANPVGFILHRKAENQ